MGDGIELPAAPTSPAAARQWATDRLESWGEADLVDTVTLLVTELVTNVLLHARTQEHDRNGGRGRIRSQAPQHLEPIQLRHGDVEHGEVRPALLRGG